MYPKKIDDLEGKKPGHWAPREIFTIIFFGSTINGSSSIAMLVITGGCHVGAINHPSHMDWWLPNPYDSSDQKNLTWNLRPFGALLITKKHETHISLRWYPIYRRMISGILWMIMGIEWRYTIESYHQEITNATNRNAGLMDFLRISSLGIPKSIGKSSVSQSNGHFRSFLCVWFIFRQTLMEIEWGLVNDFGDRIW